MPKTYKKSSTTKDKKKEQERKPKIRRPQSQETLLTKQTHDESKSPCIETGPLDSGHGRIVHIHTDTEHLQFNHFNIRLHTQNTQQKKQKNTKTHHKQTKS